MHVLTHITDADVSTALNSYVERRLHFALSRFGGRVGPITVRIAGHGPAANRCRITAEVLPFGRVTIEEIDTDLFAAIDRATGRMGRLFGRELERWRNTRLRRESVRTAA